jgi:outer membrane protein OmpA-like peptidoglycan-associated protein
LSGQLDTRMKQLQSAYRAQKITRQKLLQQQDAIKRETESKIAALRQHNEKAQAELDQAKNELQATSSKLGEAETTVAKLGEEKTKLQGELEGSEGRHKADVARMMGDFEKQKSSDRAAFEGQLAKEKLSGAERAAKEAAFKADAERKSHELEGKMADLGKKYRDSQGQLAKANENLNARKNLAEQIKKSFKGAGVGAEVDPNNGDVLLSFNGQYFDTGRADLKSGMREILQQAMPAYSASLFEDPKIADKIQSVEIVGFASPTFKGKFVDPASMSADDRQAVNYNLDLSYNRARSIFNYVFDQSKMSFKHQKKLLPLVKVTGRSFLATDKARDPAGNATTMESFCRKNDCAKLQRVVIKFTLKD